MRLSLIRNNPIAQRITRIRSRRWEAARTTPLDNIARQRAQSLLAGTRYRDGSTNPGTLTLTQSHDVLAWANVRI